MMSRLKKFLFPRKLADKLRNLAILALCFWTLYYWTDAENRYIRSQRNILLALPPDTRPDSVQARHHRVRDRCQVLDRHGLSRSPSGEELQFPATTIIAPDLFYCPVATVASTFLTRFVLAIDGRGKNHTPYSIPIGMADKERMGHLHSLENYPRQRQFLAQATKFVFGRDPFSRIFSSYIDKLYSPNPKFWQEWGQRSVAMSYDLDLDPERFKCGGAFTSFRHFVKLVVKDLWKRDEQLVPVSTLCQLCNLSYDVIGKIENPDTDFRFLSSKLSVAPKFMDSPTYRNDVIKNVIKDATRDAFGAWKNDIKQCMNSFEMGSIIWRKLQIKGIIDARFNFPLTRSEMKGMNRKKFRDYCNMGALKSPNKERLALQRQKALEEAYRTVDRRDLGAIQGIYASDFYLLGYDFNPPAIFGNSNRKRLSYSPILDWRRPLE